MKSPSSNPDALSAEEVAQQIEALIIRMGWDVRRLGPFLLIDVGNSDENLQAFGVHISEIL